MLRLLALTVGLLEAAPLAKAPPKVSWGGSLPLAAAPLAAPSASALAPILLPQAAALPVSAVPSAPPAAAPAPEAAQTLIESLVTAPLPKSDLPSAEASAAAESDFMARAQLGKVHAGAGAVEASGAQTSGRSWLSRFTGRAPRRDGGRELDDAARMSAALTRLAQERAVTLDFMPGPAALKRVAEHQSEVLLTRERGTGVWTLSAGETHAVSDAAQDYDMALHNHVELRMGAYSLYSPYPSPDDLVLGRGKRARLFVISREGVAEWNPDTGYADAAALRRGLERDLFGKLVMRLTFPWYYPTALKRAGIAAELRPWSKVTSDWLARGEAPKNAHTAARALADLPRAELAAVAARMRGEPLTRAEAEAKAVSFKFRVQRWFESFYNDVTQDMTAAPDGVCYPDSRIELFVKPDWRKYPSLTDHFRVLITHEYAHRLQNEGLYTRRWGVEIPAVAVELLRAVELAGLERLKAGHIRFIGEGVLGSFEGGRAWARSGSGETMGFYSKGFLPGAAYELAQTTGRPADAWEFVRRVSAQKIVEDPRAVYEDIRSR